MSCLWGLPAFLAVDGAADEEEALARRVEAAANIEDLQKAAEIAERIHSRAEDWSSADMSDPNADSVANEALALHKLLTAKNGTEKWATHARKASAKKSASN